MRKLTFTIAIFLCVSLVFAQEKKEKMLLNIFSSHAENPQYVYGKIKEIHYQPYYIIEENGKVLKGNPILMSQSQNDPLRQSWSYYYNEPGQLIKMSVKDDAGIMWNGVVHYNNNRIENIYFLRGDTVMLNWDYEYLNGGDIELKWIWVQNNFVSQSTIYELDKNGFMKKSVIKDKDGKIGFTAEYTRNPDGTLKIYKGLDENGKDKHLYTNYKYNEKGLVISSRVELLNGSNPNFPDGETSYEYDEYGNWTKCIHKGWIMIERKFIYYN